MGDKAAAAMTRRGTTRKCNISDGAGAEPLRIDNTPEDMSVRAVMAPGAEYAGADVLPSDGGGYSLTEVNTVPGRKGLKKATGSAAEALADYVSEERL
ncbi:hypothetical protein QUF80_11855 [Desulfococcaceae bacterium HSG8]|nr:hypothetical protein [Desulfococcaceae bacterium HSG8]